MQDQITLIGTIGSGATTSSEFVSTYNTAEPCGGRDLIGLQVGTFTGTNIGLLANLDGGTSFLPVVNVGGTTVDIKLATNKYVPLDSTTFQGFATFKATAGSAQGQATTIYAVARRNT